MAEKRKAGFSFGSPVNKSPFVSRDFLSEENRPSPSGCFGNTSFELQQQSERQNKPEENKTPPPVTINFSPSFCFYGDQTPNNNSGGNLTINFTPSFSFYVDERQNKPHQQPPLVNNNFTPSPAPFGGEHRQNTCWIFPEQQRQNNNNNNNRFLSPPLGYDQPPLKNKTSSPSSPFEQLKRQHKDYFSEIDARIKRCEPLVSLGESMVKQTDFSLSLAKHVISTTKAKDANFVFSPLSMHVVLSMVAAGSAGPTRAQFLEFLKSESVEELNSLLSQVSTLLFADGGSLGGPRLSFANGVWVDQSLTLKPAFKEIVDKDYKAASRPADFKNKADEERKEVNSWAEKETNGLIKDLLPPGSVDDLTRLILANALYFKGVWDKKFDASLTKDMDFFLLDGKNSVRAPLMTSRNPEHAVGVFDGFKVLRLQYEQGDDSRRFSMLIYLPHATDGLPALLHKFGSEPDFIQNHLPGRSVVSRNFRVPKFKIGFGFEATQVLKGHGLVLPFSPGGMTEMVEKGGERLYISSFFHKSCIEVDEKGTEAAAASACVISASYSMGPPPKVEEVDFVADHPFLFVVREELSGGVLFAGQLLNPIAA